MIHNVGKIDRIVRIILGVVLMAFYFTHFLGARYDTFFLVGGMLMFITSLRRCCPLYAILGMGTCEIRKPEGEAKIKAKKLDL